MNSKEVAMEALALTATQYNYLHKYMDAPSYTNASPFTSTSPLDLIDRLSEDERFDKMFDTPSFSNIDTLFQKHETLVLEYWNAWSIEDPVKQFRESQELAVALLVSTVRPGTHAYNFFVVHLLTTSHAVRILLPFIPTKFQVPLVREWWLLTLAVYIAQLRPKIDPDNVASDLKGRHWTYVEEKALNSKWSTDAHFVKGRVGRRPIDEMPGRQYADTIFVAIRSMKQAAMTWGDVHEHYLASAITFVDNFQGWVH
jgi:hypothetical protein